MTLKRDFLWVLCFSSALLCYSLFQCLTTLSTKKLFLISDINLLWRNLRPLHEKRVSTVNHCIEVIASHHFAGVIVHAAFEGTVYSESALQLWCFIPLMQPVTNDLTAQMLRPTLYLRRIPPLGWNLNTFMEWKQLRTSWDTLLIWVLGIGELGI